MLNSIKISNKGFTLVELLVAISILGVLSTIGLTVYTGAQRQARDAKRIGDIKEIQKALEQHYALNRNYPAKIYGTVAETGNIGVAFQAGEPPRDPNRDADATPPNDPYDYVQCATTNRRYIVCAQLEENGGNRSDVATDACNDSVTTSTSDNDHYCAGALSN